MAQGQFGEAPPGWARVQTICEWINQHITYQYGTSDAGTSAYDTAAQRIGVCRDFAHLGITRSAAPWAFPPATSAATAWAWTRPTSTPGSRPS